MKWNEESKHMVSPNQSGSSAHPPCQSFAIYTVFYMFFQIRDQLGLEAALTFAQKYIQVMERQDPRLRETVALVAQGINLKTLYKQVCDDKKID